MERFQKVVGPEVVPRIAYFSMEFGLHQIPIYAGGLGMLAGDHLKGASDMGLPIVGVGLYYRYGYFVQKINVEGFQEEIFREADVHNLPMHDWKGAGEESIHVTIEVLGNPLVLRIWRAQVGRVPLLLLDANLPENPPELRCITDHLYVSDRERRIMQEIVLGVGGFRALQTVGIVPEVYHLNEGHSAFLLIERLKKLVCEDGFTFDEASALIKYSTVFTTHTPVEAGNENFPVDTIRKYLAADVEKIGMPFEKFAEHAFLHDQKTFWMPALAIRFSRHINGVSELHAGVSRQMWRDLFPGRRDPGNSDRRHHKRRARLMDGRRNS